MSLELPRIVMGDQLSPEDASQMAEVSGAELRIVTHTSSLIYRNGWTVGISHDRLPSGLYTSALHAFNIGVDLPTRVWTDRGVVIAEDGVTIVRLEDPEGLKRLNRINLRNGLADVQTELYQNSSRRVLQAAELAFQRFPRSPRRG